jgi:putative membrane protein
MSARDQNLATMSVQHSRLPVYFFGFYLLYWIELAIAPQYRFDWFLENLLVFATVPWLVHMYIRRPLSNFSYVLILLFYCLHTLGSHYTYSEVPVGFWISEMLGLERNHYDRIVHFAFGLLICYPLSELIQRSARPRGNWSLVFGVLVVCTFSLFYETIEWIVASIVSPEASMAFLGTQGDVFDAQKDGALASLGAIIAALVGWRVRPFRNHATRRN